MVGTFLFMEHIFKGLTWWARMHLGMLRLHHEVLGKNKGNDNLRED